MKNEFDRKSLEILEFIFILFQIKSKGGPDVPVRKRTMVLGLIIRFRLGYTNNIHIFRLNIKIKINSVFQEDLLAGQTIFN